MRIFILAIAVVAVRGQLLPQDLARENLELEAAVKAANHEQQQAVNLETSVKCLTPRDPNDTALCYPLPYWMKPDPFIKDVQGVTYWTVYWWWVGALRKTIAMARRGNALSLKCMSTIPKKFIKAVDDSGLETQLTEQARNLHIRAQWKPDWREYYWQIDCPYRKKWMYSFMHKYYGRCYLMYLWNYNRTPYTDCIFDECRTRCHYLHPYLKNAICTATQYRYYKRWMWCPYMSKWCKLYPCLCFRWIKFKLPMNCKCMQCWYRGRSRIDSFKAAAAEEENDEEPEMEQGPPEGFDGDDDAGD